VTARDHLDVADPQPSDVQREHVVRELKKHCGDGRLTLDELEQRIAEAYAAPTTAELDHALRELPRAPATLPPVRPVRAGVATTRSTPATRTTRELADHRAAEIALKAHLYTYIAVIALLVMIYALTSPGGYFWPIWPAMGWGTAVAIQAGVTKAATKD
jgi:hypothetical protein